MANDTKELLFAEHLKYELEMFDEAARFLDSPQFAALDRTKRDQWFRYNSAIEAFWIHARLLIEFLSNPQKSLDFSGNHASARDCADKYQYDQHLKWAYDKINEQVAHFNGPAPGSEDTELGVLMELEVGHGETEVYAGVQA